MASNLLGRYIWEISELSRSRHGLTLAELNLLMNIQSSNIT